MANKKSWFNKLSFWQKSGVFLLGLALIVLTLYAGLFSLVGAPEPHTLFFEENGGIQSFDVVLDSNRTVDSAFLVFSFDSVAGSTGGVVSVSPLQSITVRDEDDDDDELETAFVSLYKVPVAVSDIAYDYRVEASTTGSVRVGGSGDRARAEIEIMYVDRSYPYNSIQYCTKDSRDDCSNEEVLLLHSYERSNGDDNYVILDDINIVNSSSEQRFSIRNDDNSLSGIIFAEGTIPHDKVVAYGGDLAFIVMPWEYDVSATADIVSPADVKVFYRDALYPSDVELFVGGVQIEVYEGLQKDSFVSIGVGDVINSYCRRSVNVDDCVVPVTIKSSTGGVVIIEEQIDKKFAVITPVPSPVVINNTVVEETVIETTKIINQTFIERIESNDGFQSWYWYVIIGFPAVLFVGLFVFLKRKR